MRGGVRRADSLIFLDGCRRRARCVEAGAAGAHGAEECDGLIASGVATGGMQAKLNAALAALDARRGAGRIAPGARRNVLGAIVCGGEDRDADACAPRTGRRA